MVLGVAVAKCLGQRHPAVAGAVVVVAASSWRNTLHSRPGTRRMERTGHPGLHRGRQVVLLLRRGWWRRRRRRLRMMEQEGSLRAAGGRRLARRVVELAVVGRRE